MIFFLIISNSIKTAASVEGCRLNYGWSFFKKVLNYLILRTIYSTEFYLCFGNQYFMKKM